MVTSPVQQFEEAFAEYVGAKYAIAHCNGTATLHTALAALGVHPISPFSSERPGPFDVAVPPLTMGSTTIAVLHAGGVPVFVDVDPKTWLMKPTDTMFGAHIPVSLYGLHAGMEIDWRDGERMRGNRSYVTDAAQTLQKHTGRGRPEFTSYSFQASKILPLGEGGMLVTDDYGLAMKARTFSSLGYPMDVEGPHIKPSMLKVPNFARHHSLGYNYRMSDLVAKEGFELLGVADVLIAERQRAASFYRDAIDGCSWITPQHRPKGWEHDYWCYAVALESAELWHPFVDAIERHGGERPYAAWRITYQEPAFRHLAEDGTCPVAEDLQPRLVQFQTNHIEAARRNAVAVSRAIKEIGG